MLNDTTGTASFLYLRGFHYRLENAVRKWSGFLLLPISARSWEERVSLNCSPSRFFEFSFYLLTFLLVF
jgi:hypothetical protein